MGDSFVSAFAKFTGRRPDRLPAYYGQRSIDKYDDECEEEDDDGFGYGGADESATLLPGRGSGYDGKGKGTRTKGDGDDAVVISCAGYAAGGADTAEEYVTVSSYGRNFDFYAPSGAVDANIQPVFTKSVVFFFISAFFVRPACCGAFMTYGRFTGDYRLFDCCLATTIFFYVVLIVESSMLYLNIRNDRMPLGRVERLLVGLLEVAGPVAFVTGASSIIFGDRRFFARVVEYPRDSAYADSIDLLTAVALVTYLSYSVLAISDVMAFVAPRLWVVAVAKTGVPF